MCCSPALSHQQLGASCTWQQQVNLTWLSLAGRCVSDDTAAVLAQMSSLRSLELADAAQSKFAFAFKGLILDRGLEQPAALRRAVLS